MPRITKTDNPMNNSSYFNLFKVFNKKIRLPVFKRIVEPQYIEGTSHAKGYTNLFILLKKYFIIQEGIK